MMRTREDLPLIHLKAGEMHCSDQPALVVTVLGSCLSITFYCRRLGIGGICHGILPSCGMRDRCTKKCPDQFTYVDCSIRRMAAFFDRFGCRRSELEVKCFGGSDMFSRPIERPGLRSVGRQNIETAEAIIKSEGLTLATRDVGGPQGRKIFFYMQTGDVLLKRLRSSADEDQATFRMEPPSGQAPRMHRSDA